ncbi:MAG TPA: RHS repeat-associated core domain-containing protein [Streptosporangiaceae bacterium]|nr:RHS repeat-associated core domain-containing protein [Streptosporangiaceae bacterium]
MAAELETVSSYTASSDGGITYTNHYTSNTASSPAWVSGSDNSWTRSVDFNGNLAADVTASGVTLELPDLHGDIMATAGTSSASAGPAATYVYNEFGVAESGTTGGYGWLGAHQISGNALGGQLLMGVRAYNPDTGRFSQTDPVPGGSANAYDYAAQNPVTNFDLTGTWLRSCAEWTFWQRCTTWFTEWETRGLIATLDSIEGWCDQIANLPWTWAAIVAHACYVFGLDSKILSSILDAIDNLGRRRGIHFTFWYWRYWWWWWWFGWHHSGWIYGWGYIWHN